MTVTVKNIIPPKQAEAAQTLQYTASNCKTLIDKFTVTNTTATAATFAANLVPYGGTASDSNLIMKTRTIAAGEQALSHILDPYSVLDALRAWLHKNFSSSGWICTEYVAAILNFCNFVFPNNVKTPQEFADFLILENKPFIYLDT